MGIGLFPSLFTLNFTWDEILAPGASNGGADSGNPELPSELNLKRLLGLFVVLIIISFILLGSDVFVDF